MKNKENKQVVALEVLKRFTQTLAIKDGFPENTLTKEGKNELNKIKKIEKKVDRENLVYRTNKYTHSFQNFRT